MTEHFITVSDGTQIFVDVRGPVTNGLVPILCLPGLTRNSKDFAPVFEIYATRRGVIAMDLRGRGRSQHADPKTYTVAQEAADVIKVLAALKVKKVALIGTSRGGLIGQVMAATNRKALAGLFLNDIGPEINPVGLKRILLSISEQNTFENWSDAASKLAKASVGFTGVSPEQWMTIARRIYTERDNHPCADYDPELTRHAMSVGDIDAGKLQNLWGMTPALKNIPVAVLRGENSDLLSADTVAKMHSILPQLKSITVPERGHVPFLDEAESLAAIHQWLAAIDIKEKGRH